MRILITGGAGFIGSHLAENHLLRRGNFVQTIDNYETGRPDNINGLLRNGFHRIDICEHEILEKIFKLFPPDVVVHCAASYKNPSNWRRDAEVNCVGTANICGLSKRYNIQRIIYLQTSLCYGLNPYRVVHYDGSIDPISIDHPLDPAPNSYAITKTAGEQMIAMSGVPFISFRLANCYGPRNLSGPIPTFYRKLMITKERCTIVNTKRDFVYIDDLINLVIRAVEGEGTKNYYHVSTGRDYWIYEVYQTIVEAIIGDPDYLPKGTIQTSWIPNRVARSPEDVETILLDPSETHKDFPGWSASTPLEKGIKKTIQWYKEHGVIETYTHLKMED